MIDEEDRIAHTHPDLPRRRWPWAAIAAVVIVLAGGVVWRDQLPAPVRGVVTSGVAAGADIFRALGIAVAGEPDAAAAETPVETAAASPPQQPVEPRVPGVQNGDQPAVGANGADPIAVDAEDNSSFGQARSLREELERDLSVAPQLAKLYRDVLAQSPGDKRAELGLTELRDFHYRYLEDALAQRDLEQSEHYLNSLRAIFPAVTTDQRFQALADSLQRAQQAQVEIDRGNEFLVQNALTSPPQANALEAFETALDIDPDNPKANAGIERIVERYIALAEENIHKGEYETARQMAKRGLGVAPAKGELIKLEKSAAGHLDHQLKLQNLRTAAETHVQNGNLITPRGESAYDRYRELLTLNENSDAARSGIADIERRLALQIEDAINAANFTDARNKLLAAREAFPNSERLLALQVSLDRAVEADFIARQPKIPQILVSNSLPDTIDAEQKATLTVDRTLYIGFSYDNFATATSVVQAILYDGSRSIQIAQVPVIVSGKKGVKFFPIDRPVESFAAGGYNIDLVLNGERLGTQAFKVERAAVN